MPEKNTLSTIIRTLAKHYPKTFNLSPALVRPLKDGILEDIVSEFGETVRKPTRRALMYYKHWPSYLIAVSMGKKRRDLSGNKVQRIPIEEREKAREELLKLGKWDESLQRNFEICSSKIHQDIS